MSGQTPTGWEGADRWFAPQGDDAPAPGPVCETCGEPLEADQTYCLECGSPTPLAPRLRRGGRGPVMLAGAMVVLGLGAGALAFAVVDDDSPSDASTGAPPPATAPAVPGITVPSTDIGTLPSTGPLPPDPSVTAPTFPATDPVDTSGATTFETVTGPSSTPETTGETTGDLTEPETETETETEPPPVTTEEASGESDWPVGTSAWTAILASVRSEPAARSAKGRVSADGEPAGVLFSTDFPALRPGYWVVFSGIFGSRGRAITQASRLRPDFPNAYARRIEG